MLLLLKKKTLFFILIFLIPILIHFIHKIGTNNNSFRRRLNINKQSKNNVDISNKTPERAEFELNIENKYLDYEDDNEDDEVEEDQDVDEDDEDFDSQNNTSSGFLSKSISEKTSNIDLDELEEEEEEEDNEDNEEEEEEEEEEEYLSEENDEYPKCELMNKKTDNLLLKLKLANNLINWEANM